MKPKLPDRPVEELFAEAQVKRAQIKLLYEQIHTGCQQIGCSNKTSCLSVNPGLHQELGITDPNDKAQILIKALDLQRKGTAKMCD